jgi:hypothetical protein
VSACPFTAQLNTNINSFAHRQPPGSGSTIYGGQEDGILGAVSYAAHPSSTGGTVTVTVTPTAAEDKVNEAYSVAAFVLTIVSGDGTLLVNNITVSETASPDGQRACGPVVIYIADC